MTNTSRAAADKNGPALLRQLWPLRGDCLIRFVMVSLTWVSLFLGNTKWFHTIVTPLMVAVGGFMMVFVWGEVLQWFDRRDGKKCLVWPFFFIEKTHIYTRFVLHRATSVSGFLSLDLTPAEYLSKHGKVWKLWILRSYLPDGPGILLSYLI